MLEEIRDDQYLKMELLKILIEVDRVCRILNIKYTLSSGTLLGAVRHKGFIPWDDDIDIGMTRDNYEKFLNLAQKVLKNKYFLQTYETDNNNPCNFAKVLNTEIPIIEKDKIHLKIKRGLFIDIFPIDKIPNSFFERFLFVTLLRVVKTSKYSANIYNILKNSQSNIKKLFKLLIFPIVGMVGMKKMNKLENFVRNYPNNKYNKYTFADMDYGILSFTGKEMKISIFENYTELPFEGIKFMCIKDYDLYLKKIYGNYMELPPCEERIAHHGLVLEK